MTCGASSLTSQPPNIAGTLNADPGTGRIALATRAEVTSWRRRYDMAGSLVRPVTETRTCSHCGYASPMKRLSGLDASFLYFETPEQLLHVCGLVLLDPETIPGGYSFD